MTLDSSALFAILFAEAGHLDLVDRILDADHVRVGAPTLVETMLVLAGRRPSLAAASAVIPFGERESEQAVDACLRFGRGRHPAGLNFGDCFAYRTSAASNGLGFRLPAPGLRLSPPGVG